MTHERHVTYRDAAGDVRLQSRHVVLQPESSLRCAHGHALREPAHALRESVVMCHARGRDGQACRSLVYLVRAFTQRNGTERALVVHVTDDEVRRMRHFTEAARLRYLGLEGEAIA